MHDIIMKRNVISILMLLVSASLFAQSDTENVVTFTKGLRATIILPITPDASKGRYYRLDRCENEQIVFEEELSPKARVPYIIVPNEDFCIDLKTLDLEGYNCDAVSIEGISFIGSYIRCEFDYLECYYIDIIDTTPDCTEEGGQFHDTPTIGALRAYLQVDWDLVSNLWEKMEVVLHDYTNSLMSPSFYSLNYQKTIYDLSGRRVVNPKRGLYIQGGKKKLKR